MQIALVLPAILSGMICYSIVGAIDESNYISALSLATISGLGCIYAVIEMLRE